MVWPKQPLPSASTRLGGSEDASHSQRVVNVPFEHLVDEDVQRHALYHHVEFFILKVVDVQRGITSLRPRARNTRTTSLLMPGEE